MACKRHNGKSVDGYDLWDSILGIPIWHCDLGRRQRIGNRKHRHDQRRNYRTNDKRLFCNDGSDGYFDCRERGYRCCHNDDRLRSCMRRNNGHRRSASCLDGIVHKRLCADFKRIVKFTFVPSGARSQRIHHSKRPNFCFIWHLYSYQQHGLLHR